MLFDLYCFFVFGNETRLLVMGDFRRVASNETVEIRHLKKREKLIYIFLNRRFQNQSNDRGTRHTHITNRRLLYT